MATTLGKEQFAWLFTLIVLGDASCCLYFSHFGGIWNLIVSALGHDQFLLNSHAVNLLQLKTWLSKFFELAQNITGKFAQLKRLKGLVSEKQMFQTEQP